MKSKSIRYAVMIAMAVVGYWIWQSDVFQRELFPVDYWTARVAVHEQKVRQYKEDITMCVLELRKMERTRDLIIRQSVLEGSPVDQAKIDYADDALTYQQLLSVSKELYQEEMGALKAAKEELLRITGENK